MSSKPEMLLWLSDARGIYIPRDFAQSFKDRNACVEGVKDEQWAVLEAGPDHEHYWDVWMEVCDSAIVTDEYHAKYRVEQDGDCWLIPVGMVWNDEKDAYEWPEEVRMKVSKITYVTGVDEGWHFHVNYQWFGPFKTKKEAERTMRQVKEMLKFIKNQLIEEIKGMWHV